MSGRWLKFRFREADGLAGETSRMMVPSGFLFLRGFPNLGDDELGRRVTEDQEHTSWKVSSCSRYPCYRSGGR